MIRVVWTDFGGVLTPPVGEDLARVARAAGVPVEALLAAVRAVAPEDGLLADLELGRLTEREWGERVTGALLPLVPAVDLGRFGEHWHRGRALNLGLLDVLTALEGVELAMLTNTIAEWEPHRSAMIPDKTVFRRIISSHEVGVRKPEDAMFALAEETFDTRPEECLLIDDLEVNCAAAARRGWSAILHADTRNTVARLGELLG
ncbi:HAD-IA family hydrolase [Actinosynnema sp. NPDC020468]|uniref:HAD-IA family hydrolase n=1 Tax=Actinosynnema sp. NPDC020468 TaxID=3154488 RepID=UPI0033FB8996